MNDFDSILLENRYPFDNFNEFISGKYFLSVAGMHLTIAWIVVVVMIVRVLRSRQPIAQSFVILYFALALYTNPAFTILGLQIGDFFGISCFLMLAWKLLCSRPMRITSPVGYALLICFAIFLAHFAVVSVAYPSINQNMSDFAERFVLITKVLVFAAAVLLFDVEFKTTENVDRFVRELVFFGLVGIAVYGLQILVLLSGTEPYGTYLDAGWVGFPSFGSVAVERGHFGKFLTPLYPFFLICLTKHKWRFVFGAFVVCTLINFSASSQVYFVGYALLTLYAYREMFRRPKVLATAGIVIVALTGFAISFGKIIAGVVGKIDFLVFIGGNHGGRTSDILAKYLDIYPMGTSYGGSTMRTPAGLPEINSGIYTFISQLSLVSVPLILGYGLLCYVTVRFVAPKIDSDYGKAAIIGILMSIGIFASDVLWFVPTIWAPMIVAYRMYSIKKVAAVSGGQG